MEELRKRIDEVLELELGHILDERGMQTGDITPMQWLEWNRITTEAATLFAALIEQNK